MAKRKPNNPKRNRLLAIGMKLFARKGYHATSTREIVQAAGVTKPMLYYYFNSKEGLCKAGFEKAMGKLKKSLAGIPENAENELEGLVEIVWRSFEHSQKEPDFTLLFEAFHFGPEEELPGLNLKAQAQVTRQRLEQEAARLVARGLLKPGCEHRLARVLEGVIHAWIIEGLKGDHEALTKLYARQLVHDLVHGFAMKPSASAKSSAPNAAPTA